jgi:hypothetical protein
MGIFCDLMDLADCPGIKPILDQYIEKLQRISVAENRYWN